MQQEFFTAASEDELSQLKTIEKSYIDIGFPADLARRTVVFSGLFPVLDVVETAAQRKMDVQSVARVYFGLGDSLRIGWLRKQFENLPVKGQWHALARASLRDELFAIQNTLVEQILRNKGKHEDAVERWSSDHQQAIKQVDRMLQDMSSQPSMDYATASIAVRALQNLVAVSDEN